jgi:hypothetical protein
LTGEYRARAPKTQNVHTGRLVLARVSTIAALLVVLGTHDALMGLCLCGAAAFLAAGGSGRPLERLPAESRVAVLVFGPLLAAVGALKITAGLRNYRYRGERLGLAALASCVASALVCYCAPLALGLLGYGLYVYTRPEVERAFLMGRQGLSREWIRASADSRRPRA